MSSIRTEITRAIHLAWQRTYSKHRGQKPGLTGALDHCLERAASDAAAARERWQVPTAVAPHRPDELRWFRVLDQARVETLASLDLPGMALNLSDVNPLVPEHEGAARLYCAARALFGSGEFAGVILLPTSHASKQATGFLEIISTHFRSRGKKTAAPLSIPVALTDAEAKERLLQARSNLDNPKLFAQIVYPIVKWFAINTPDTNFHEPGLGLMQDTGEACQATDSKSTEDLCEGAAQTYQGEAKNHVAPPATCSSPSNWPCYTIYSRQWDEERSAASFFNSAPTEARNLLADPKRDQICRLAHRLQRRLLSAQQRRWAYDQEEGRLDGRRLAHILNPVGNRNVFRRECEAPTPKACVTFLVDQSGSMDGKRRAMAAQAIDLAVQTLETCCISSEVLGFTTRYGADSRPLAHWLNSGAPAGPGRLNALRHIVYKGANQPWRRCRKYLTLLLRDGFGRENIDGESLDWAARRLALRPESRKILLILSDGAPCDGATQQANGRAYLENHLRQVIAALEASPIHLTAIGTGQDVGRFYRHALTMRYTDEVGPLLYEHLGSLLTQPHQDY